MASKSIELIIELLIKEAGGDLSKVEKQVQAITKAYTDLKSKGQLQDMFKVQPVVDKIAELKAALTGLRQQRALGEIAQEAHAMYRNLQLAGGAMKNVGSIDVSKIKVNLEALGKQAQHFYQQLTAAGKVKLDVDLSKAATAMEKLNVTVGTFKASWQKPVKVEVDTSKATASLGKVSKAAKDAAVAKERLNVSTRRTDEHFRLLNTTLGNAANQFLFLRRVVIAVAGVNLAGRILDAVAAFDRLNQSMRVVFGVNAAEELGFIRQTAERLGLSLTDLATGWAKFAASVDPAKVSIEQMRENFLAVAEAGARLSLSNEEISGTLTALSQIASKGRLSMEELRQQLGDRLPGAVKIAADALGLTQAKLFALIEQGKIGSDVFLNAFPKALRASFGTDQNTRIETIGAAIQRLKNAFQEMLNAAVRAGALDVFVRIVDDLAKRFKDPAFIESLQEVANTLVKIARAAFAAGKPVIALTAAFLGWKALVGIRSAVIGMTEAMLGFAGAAGGASRAVGAFVPVATTAAQVAVGGKENFAGWTSQITAFGRVLTVAAGALGGLTLAYIAGKAAADAWVDSLIEGEQKLNRINEAVRESESAGRLSGFFASQVVALEEYGKVSVLTTEQVKALTTAQAQQYLKGVEGAQALAAAQQKQAEQGIKQAQEEIKALQLRGDYSDAARKRTDELLLTISRLRDTQREATARTTELGIAFSELEKRGDAVGLSFELSAETLRRMSAAADSAADSMGKVAKLDLSKLSKDTQFIVTGFQQATERGESLAKAIETALPKSWLDGTSKQISEVGDALAFLVQEGLVPASKAADALAKDLGKLDADALAEFGIKAQVAFDAATVSAQGLDVLLAGQLTTSLKKLGVDAEFAGKNISKTFNELTTNFSVLAENVRATGLQIKEGLDIAVAAAKTKEELQLLASAVDNLGLRTGKFATELEDSFLRLDDKIRLTAATLNSALGDSFDRLGIKSKAMLQGLADQAVIDFNRIKASGIATALELEAAFRKMAEEVAKTNNGIPPISLRIEAINNNAFDVLVSMAQKASERIKKAMLDAIPLADTLDKLRLLAEGIEVAFDRGKISAQEFSEVMFTVGQNMRDAMAKPAGEVLAIVEKFGFQTKDMLQATADNAREAFDAMRFSGEFTTGELAKGAQLYLDAYKAANDGVVDSFDPVVQKALEVVNAVDQAVKKVDEIKSIGDPIATGNLRDKTTPQLQLELDQLTKAYRAIGIQNVQDLQIIQEIQKEIQRQSKIDAEERRKVIEEAGQVMTDAAENLAETTREARQPAGAPLPGGALAKGGPAQSGQIKNLGGDTININLNGSGQLTPDEVKRKVIPAIRVRDLRRR